MLISDSIVSSDSRWTDAAVPGRRVGHTVEFHESLPSTNDRARQLLAEPDGEGTVVVADLQTAGRGRRGRQWLSPSGANLLMSVALRPRDLPVEHGAWIGAAAAVAVVRACADWTPLAIRWPNDLVTGEGLKVAGLLVETAAVGSTLAEAVIGIGTNVNWSRDAMPPEIAPLATSLAERAGGPLDRVAVLGRLLAELDVAISRLEAGISPIPDYAAASMLTGSSVEVDLGDGRLTGLAVGIADDGALVLDTENGRVALAVGEVVRVRPAGESKRG
jgi:BirA family biotin operon repressor/biotin-[acetyl-CoA-carboxylase] ligase